MRAVSRALDVAVAGAALLVLSPVLAVVAAGIWATLGRPLFFRQIRPGRKGRLFTCIKFRTMSDKRDENGELLPDEERMTRVGTLLREVSLDELPQLWSVLKGDMALVGPRPLLPQYLPLYSDRQRKRHDVRPGITGWAQINGRNAIGWQEKFERDVWYVENWSLWLDLRILLLTPWVVLRRVGISEEGRATTSAFLGNRDSTGFGRHAL